MNWRTFWAFVLIAGSIALGGLVVGAIVTPPHVTVMTVAEFNRTY